MSDNTNEYQVLLDVVRQNYASVVWTHKIQIKQADIYATRFNIVNWFSRRSLQFFHIGSLSFCISVKHFDFVHILLYLVHDESERESTTASCETWAVLTNNFKEAAKIIAALLNSKQKR